MATYYKYAERDATSQVNWAEIGKNMTDMLANETKIREQKKAEIDKASREYAETLANSPMGESESARAMSLKFGDNASQYMLMQDRLLKSGQLRLSDYTVMRQNLLDDTDHAFGMLKDYQAKYKEKMDRYKNNESMLYELDAMERIEGFGKFSESGLYIDPTSGKVTIAMMEKDPATGGMVMPKTPNQRASINTVRGMLMGQWNKYDPNAPVDKLVASMGENIQTIRKIGKRTQAGEIMTVTDVLASVRKKEDVLSEIESKMKVQEGLSSKIVEATKKGDKKTAKTLQAEYDKIDSELKPLIRERDENSAVYDIEQFENDSITGMLANDWDRLSLLTDNMTFVPNSKEKYYFERDPEKAKNNPAAILMVPSKDNNGSEIPQFTEEQIKSSNEWMRTQMRARYDYKEQRQTVSDYQAPQQQQQWQYEAGKDKKQSGDLLSQWQKLYSAGNAADKRAAAQSLLGNPKLMEMGITNIDMSDGKNVNLIYANGTSRTIPLYTEVDGKEVQVSPTQWAAQGTELHGVTDSNQFNRYKGDTFQDVSDWSGVNAVRTVATTSP
jgi:hypothetical protein